MPAIRAVILTNHGEAGTEGEREANCFRAAARARLICSPLYLTCCKVHIIMRTSRVYIVLRDIKR